MISSPVIVSPVSSHYPLIQLGRALQAADYAFVTVTPETHRRVVERPRVASAASDRPRALRDVLRDVFGWNRVFAPSELPASMLAWLREANACESVGNGLRSRIRFSSLHGGLYMHSGYPTTDADAVFFGPDTYRFCSFLRQCLPVSGHVVDVGCGSGAGGLSLSQAASARVAERMTLCDVNPRALQYSAVNCALAGVEANIVHSDVLAGVEGSVDVVIANPPYMRDPLGRVYRDGGGTWGEALSVRIVRESLQRLAPRGRLLLYTGSAIVRGEDTFLRAVAPHLHQEALRFEYQELDPDVFGEELEKPSYADVERIAAVGLRVQKP